MNVTVHDKDKELGSIFLICINPPVSGDVNQKDVVANITGWIDFRGQVKY